MAKQKHDTPKAAAAIAEPSKSKLELVENVRQFSRFMRSVIELADAVGDVDSLERQAKEAEARLAVRRGEEDALLADRLAAVDRAEQRRLAVEKQAADAAAKSLEAVANAKNEAFDIVAKAKQAARDLEAGAKAATQAAQSEADAIREQARQEGERIVAAAKQAEASALLSVDAWRQTAAELDRQCGEKQAELAAVEKKLTAARAKIAKMLE